MANNTDMAVTNAVIKTIVAIVAILAIFWLGHWRGASSVVKAEMLTIESEMVYKIVPVQETPTEAIVKMAQETCAKESISEIDTCVNTFLSQFSTIYVVNLVSGVYSRLGANGPVPVDMVVPK